VTVRFRRGQYVPPRRVQWDVSERQRDILSLLEEARDGLALREIVLRLTTSATTRQVRRDLADLRTLGLTVSEGHGRGARWRRQRNQQPR